MTQAVYRMPSLGADMEAGTLIEWAKHPGDPLANGDVIAVVETQKGAIEVEVFHPGIMGRTLVEPGQTVPVGTAMAEIELIGEASAQEAMPERPISEARPPSLPSRAPAAEPTPAAGGRRRISPAARRLAAELGVDLSRIPGSGSTAAILLADVRAAAGTRPPPSRGRLDLTAMREAIAAAMAKSKREIPHYYLGHDIDLTAAASWLGRRNADLPPERRILLGVLFIKAVALTLHDFPELNGFHRDGRLERAAGIHVGAAIAIRGGGLVAPAIHDTDRLDLQTLMERLRDLVGRARAGTLRGSELADPTITVSSLGERGADRLDGIIYPPQVALVGLGTPRQRPWVVDGAIAPRLVVTATLAADHRHSDGHRGAGFLSKLSQRLQEPETL